MKHSAIAAAFVAISSPAVFANEVFQPTTINFSREYAEKVAEKVFNWF